MKKKYITNCNKNENLRIYKEKPTLQKMNYKNKMKANKKKSEIDLMGSNF